MKQSARTAEEGLRTSISALHACIRLRESDSIVIFELPMDSINSKPTRRAIASAVPA
jgi:hypothetical protein